MHTRTSKQSDMAGIKRKSVTSAQPDAKSKNKKVKVDKPAAKRSTNRDAIKPAKSSKKAKRKGDSDTDELIESDTSEGSNGFYGFSANKSAGASADEGDDTDTDVEADFEDGDGSNKKTSKKARINDNNSVKKSGPSENKSLALANLNGKLV